MTVPAVVEFCPGERQDDIPDKDAENEQIAGTLAELPIRSVHDKREFPRRKEREQDVQDILLGETSIMEHSRHHPGDGVRCRSAVNVKGNLAVEGGFSLQDAQNDLGNAAQTVGAVMRKTLFEVGGERVNMGEGSSGLFHTLYELPFVVFSAFWTPFFLTCQVLRTFSHKVCQAARSSSSRLGLSVKFSLLKGDSIITKFLGGKAYANCFATRWI